MLFKIALVLLVAWLLGAIGVYTVGPLLHVLLLVGLMLLLLVSARALERRREIRSQSKEAERTGTRRS